MSEVKDKLITAECLKNAYDDNKSAISALKEDITRSKEAIKDLTDKKITKFYASNLGETTLNDSDNGKITDMFIFGKSYQYQGELELEDGTTVTVPCPDYPQEIKSVVNPSVKVCGKNLLNPTLATTTSYGVTLTNNGNGTYALNGTATENVRFMLGGNVKLKKGVSYKFLGAPDGCSNSTYYLYTGLDGKYCDVVDKNGVIVIPNTDSEISLNAYVYKGYTVNNLLFKPMITTDLNATYDDYEPYKGNQSTIPYTLNAIPVSSGGNVTIDGQRYIADYVDVERKKLVRCVKELVLTSWEKEDKFFYKYVGKELLGVFGFCEIAEITSKWSEIENATKDNIFLYAESSGNISIVSKNKTLEQINSEYIKFYLILVTPTETDLTDEEVQAFKELATYYPTTNVMVTSDQLDGYTTFNYQISLANGWNLIKEQLGDTRDYIYDMELQSAEAYVNSEYAVTLTELGV